MAERDKKDVARSQFQKLQKAEEGKKAMSEYETDRAAVLAKTARLRALRLAKEEADRAAAPSAAPKKTRAKRPASSASLSDWLKKQQAGGRRS